MTDIIGGGAAPTSGQPPVVKDATIETFQADVLQASMQVPVIVDFWATWCGPCKTLGPILEKAVGELGGKALMVKVDIDQNQMLAQQLRIQSVPTVMAFVGGQPVDGFAGALPESQIKQFLDRVLQMAAQAGLSGGGDQPDPKEILEAGEQALAAGDLANAMQAFAAATEYAEPDSDIAAIGLAGMARVAFAAGEIERAEQMLAAIPEQHHGLAQVAQAKAQLSLGSATADDGAVAEARNLVEANPDDAAAHFQLGEALIDAGDVDDGANELLRSIEIDREWNEGAARQKLLTLFDALSPTHPVVKSARRRLSSILFA